MSQAHVWDPSTVAAMDSIETKYKAKGKSVSFAGLNEASLCDPLKTFSPCPLAPDGWGSTARRGHATSVCGFFPEGRHQLLHCRRTCWTVWCGIHPTCQPEFT